MKMILLITWFVAFFLLLTHVEAYTGIFTPTQAVNYWGVDVTEAIKFDDGVYAQVSSDPANGILEVWINVTDFVDMPEAIIKNVTVYVQHREVDAFDTEVRLYYSLDGVIWTLCKSLTASSTEIEEGCDLTGVASTYTQVNNLRIAYYLIDLNGAEPETGYVDVIYLNVTYLAKDEVTVEVEVGEQTWIDVHPESIDFGTIDPSTTTGPQGFQIENIGSTNITEIEVTNAYEGSNPYGVGEADEYVAPNFVEIRNDETATAYLHANYVQYNDSTTYDLLDFMTAHTDVTVTYPTGYVALGRFRFENVGYFWALVPGFATNCSNGTIYIHETAHAVDVLPNTIDFTDSVATSILTLGSPGTHGAANGPTDITAIDPYCVWVDDDCTRVALVEWAQDQWDTKDGCTDDDALFYNTADPLTPSEVLDISMRLVIPYGVRAGITTSGVVTFIASAYV